MKALALLLGSMMALSGVAMGFSSIPPVFSHPKRHKKPPVVEKAAEPAPDAGPSDSPAADLADSSAVGKAVQDALDASAAKTEQRLIKAISRTVADDPSPQPAPGPTPPGPPPSTDPFLTLPPTIEGDIGDFIEITAQTNCKRVHWYVVDKGLKKFPDSALASPVSTVVSSMVGGSYRLMAVAAYGDDIVGPVEVMVVVHGAQPPPPPPPPPPGPPNPSPPPPPPPPPPNPTAAKLFVVIVDNISARDPRTTAIVTNVAFWNSVRSQGHTFLNLNTTDPDASKYKKMVDANGGVPAIILMDATNYVPGQTSLKWLNQRQEDLRLPTTTTGVQALINRYSGVQ